MIRLNTKFNYRLDIIRNHVKIGEVHPDSCSVDYRENSDVMHTMKTRVQTWQYDISERWIRDADDYIYFNGTRCFDGTWCFSSAVGRWRKEKIKYDMFTDRLRPVLTVGDKEYDFGDFVVIAAPQTHDGKTAYYDLETYDETMILKQAALTSRKYYPAGTKYLAIVGELLTDCGLSNMLEDTTDLAITADREWKVGTTYLSIINTLLSEIGYAPVHTGSHGFIYIQREINKRTNDYKYTDKNSTIIGNVVNDTDIYSLPNVIVGYVSNPDIAKSLISKRENNNPSSQISIVRRGYKVVQTKQFDDCPDQNTLDLVTSNLYMNATQATETVKLSTLPDGAHDYGSYAAVDVDGISNLYRETEWSMTFGGTMSHKFERKVLV